MSKQENQPTPTLYAVLIGINDYQRKIHKCSPLSGCVNDVLAISDFFKKLCAAQGEKIRWDPRFYLAPVEEDLEVLAVRGLEKGANDQEEREEGFYYHPTRDNIIQAFDHFAQAGKNDYCLLYYSGHGSYVFTSDVEVFSDYEPSGELQTLICADHPRRDLLDKELGYLIAKTLKDKEPVVEAGRVREGLHFLSIMDCCHSGSNTRNEDARLRSRKGKRSSSLFDHQKGGIYGFTTTGNCFYEPFTEGQTRVQAHVGLRHARYINLSAARDTESAYEMALFDEQRNEIDHGIFTYNLIRTLEKNGVRTSYKELVDRVKVEVRNWVENQYPVLGKTHEADERLLFLGRQMVNPKRAFQVGFRRSPVEEWWMSAGSMHGIVPSMGDQQTIVKISDGTQTGTAEVTEVRVTESKLAGPFLDQLDKKSTGLSATIEAMAFATVKIGFGEHLAEAMREQVRQAWQTAGMQYAELDEAGVASLFEINPLTDREGKVFFILTRAKGDRDTPLFVRHADPDTFLVDVEKVARFHSILTMENPDPEAQVIDDVEIEIQKLEGVRFGKADIATIDAKKYQPVNVEEGVTLRYKKAGGKYRQPAIKVRVSSRSGKAYTAGALFCNHAYGITSGYLPPTQIGDKYQDFAELKFRTGGEEYPAIPLNVPKQLYKQGVTEVTDYLLLFISEAPEFDLSQFDQEDVQFDVAERTRSGEVKAKTEGFEEEEEELTKVKWSTKLIPLHIIRPQEEVPISGGAKSGGLQSAEGISLAGFHLAPPVGFRATLHPTNLASARRRADQLETAGQDSQKLLPAAGLWAGLEASESVFNRNPAHSPDLHLSILELADVRGTLNAAEPLTITPGDPLAEDEAILSVAYDSESGLFLPVGYTDSEGKVRVTDLTEPTMQVIGTDGLEEGPAERSVGGSVKLFFKKLVWSRLTGIKDYHALSLVQSNGEGWERTHTYHGRKGKEEAEKEALRQALADGRPALLLLHGITGDTDGMAAAVFEKTNLHEPFGAVLAFDYENLDTTVEGAARALQRLLKDCGLQEKQLTIVGHATGGLVARCLVEQLGAAGWVRRLIQVGTPNGGMEIARLRKKASDWLTLGINGLAFFQPYLPFLAFAGRILDRNLFNSLNKLSPEEDVFEDILQGSEDLAAGVPYYLIAGNTANIEADIRKEDRLWKKLEKAIRQRGKILLADFILFSNQPNDMIVRVESMRALPWDFKEVAEVRCDHLRYFEEGEGLAALERFLQ